MLSGLRNNPPDPTYIEQLFAALAELTAGPRSACVIAQADEQAFAGVAQTLHLTDELRNTDEDQFEIRTLGASGWLLFTGACEADINAHIALGAVDVADAYEAVAYLEQYSSGGAWTEIEGSRIYIGAE